MKKLSETHDQLLQVVGAAGSKLGPEPLTTLFPMKGDKATGELMVVGRAVYGSEKNKWTPDDFSDSHTRKEILEQVIARGTNHQECPLQWLCDDKNKDYNPKPSGFWSVTQSVMSELGIQSDSDCCWASHLIWSNLFKVSPSERRDPSKKLRGVQRELCHKHLREEIAL